MDNQHRSIKGYRDLSQAEIDLMNRIKEKGAELLALHVEVRDVITQQAATLNGAATKERVDAIIAFNAAEPQRWAAIAKTDIQTGLMALIRAVAQPTI